MKKEQGKPTFPLGKSQKESEAIDKYRCSIIFYKILIFNSTYLFISYPLYSNIFCIQINLYSYSKPSIFLYSKYSLNFIRQGFVGTGYSSYICQC